MKYNININQLALSELSPDMDVNDAAVLDYIINICNSLSDKIDSRRIKDKTGEVWTWVNLQSICDDMPLLRIKSRSSLTPRIARIEKNGFISTQKKRIKGHTCLFVKLDGKVDSLFVKLDGPVRETGRAFEKPVRETGPIINTSNTIHNNTITISAFDAFWKEYPIKKGKLVARRSWDKITPSMHQVIIDDVIKRKQTDRTWRDPTYIQHPSTYLNQESWNDEIIQEHAAPPQPGVTYVKGKYDNIKGHTF